jgi:hypothetical protein
MVAAQRGGIEFPWNHATVDAGAACLDVDGSMGSKNAKLSAPRRAAWQDLLKFALLP